MLPLIKNPLLQFLVLVVSLALRVHADSILEMSRPVDPLALPLLLAGTIQPVSVASFLGNQVDSVNSDLGSLLNNNPPVENPAIVQVNINPVSFSTPQAGGFDVRPMQAMTPEPSETSLLVVGLAAIVLVFRFAPLKV